MAEMILIVGGSSSGKSHLAEEMAAEQSALSGLPVVYIATGLIYDEEFGRRVENHRQRRPADWRTIEEPCEISRVFDELEGQAGVFLLDGLGTWVTNMMYRRHPDAFQWQEEDDQILASQLQALVEAFSRMEGAVILVGDETGMGLVPMSYEGRLFRDLNGQVNQKLAAQASAVYLVSCGIPVKIKP